MDNVERTQRSVHRFRLVGGGAVPDFLAMDVSMIFPQAMTGPGPFGAMAEGHGQHGSDNLP